MTLLPVCAVFVIGAFAATALAVEAPSVPATQETTATQTPSTPATQETPAAGTAPVEPAPPAPAAIQAVDTKTLIARGKERLTRNDPKGALPILEEVLKREPDNAEVLYYVGNLYLQLGQVDPGLKSLSHSVELNPANYKLRLVLAKAHEKFASAADAIREYDEVIRTAPGTPEAKEADKQSRFLSGKIALKNNDSKQADEIFARLLHDYPNDQTLKTSVQGAKEAFELITKAGDLLGHQDFKGAIEAAESALTKDPANPRALYLAGYAHLLRKEPDEGLKQVARSVQHAPENFRLRLILAKAYDQFAHIDEAQREYQEVIRIAPNTPEAKEADKLNRVLAGKRDFSLGKAEDAQRIFERLLTEYPKDPYIMAAIAADDQISARLNEGKEKMAKKDLQGAMQSFESVLKDHPDDVRALYFAGNTALELLQPSRGIEYLSHGAKLNPDNADLRYLLGKAYQRFANPSDAIMEYQAVIRLAPGTPNAKDADKQQRFLSGKLALYDGDVKRSQALFDGLLKEYPNDKELRDSINTAHEAAGLMNDGQKLLASDPKAALEKYEATIRKDPNNIKPLFFAGSLHLQLDEPDAGLRYLSIVTALDPSNYRFRLVFAKALNQFGKRDLAAKQFEEVIHQAPGTNEAKEADKYNRIITGLRYFSQGKAAQAQATFDELAKEFPNDPSVTAAINQANAAVKLVEQGKDLMAKNKPQEAYDTFRKALQTAPDNVELLFYTGSLQMQLKQYDEGLKSLVRAADLMPENYRLRMRVADTLEANGFFGPALQEYEQVIKTAPGTPEAIEADVHYRVLLGRRDLHDQKPDDAKKVFADLLKANPSSPTLLSQIARVYLESQGLKEGLESLDALVAEVPDNVLAHSVLASLYARTGNSEKALEHNRQLLALTKTGSGAADELKLNVARLEGLKALGDKNFSEAKERFEEVLAKLPDDRASKLNLAAAYHGLKDDEKAEQIFKSLVDRDANDLAARIRLGVLYATDLKKPEDAARQFEEIRVRAPSSPEAAQASQFLSQVYRAPDGKDLQKRVQDAMIQTVRDEFKDKPDDLIVWKKLAAMYLVMGRKDEQRDALENIVRVDPKEATAQVALGDIYDQAADYAKAETAYSQAVEAAQPGQMKAAFEQKLWMTVGKKALNERKLNVAEENFKRVTAANQRDYIAHYFLAIIYNSERRFDDAAREYEEVLRLVPNHGVAHFNLGLVYEQTKREEDALEQYQAAARLPLPPNLSDTVKSQIAAVQKRINGFSYTLNYSTSYNSNYNQTKANPQYEFNSSVDGSATYRYKLYHRPVYLGMTFNPSYVTYHRNEFDIYSFSFSPFVSVSWKGVDFSTSLMRRETSNFALQRFLNTSDSIDNDVTGTFMTKPVSKWFRKKTDDMTPMVGSWSLSLTATRFKSAGTSIYDADTYSMSGTLNLPFDGTSQMIANYLLSRNLNAERLGNDSAYLSHTVGLQFNKILGPGWSAYGGYSFTYTGYSNRDSATLFKKYRKNHTHVISAGMNYFLSAELRVFLATGYRVNNSNLPTGFILSPEDAATAVGIQSSALGDYKNLSVSTGVAFSF
jgi:tetratricopeptide (TPR) repeat protein